jgi:hypothetical protein
MNVRGSFHAVTLPSHLARRLLYAPCPHGGRYTLLKTYLVCQRDDPLARVGGLKAEQIIHRTKTEQNSQQLVGLVMAKFLLALIAFSVAILIVAFVFAAFTL